MRASSISRSAIPISPTSIPLTDQSLSILGKKSGTTRVSAYAEGKKLVGVFDVEVTYDTSLLQTSSAAASRMPRSGSRRSTAASCSPAPRRTRPTVDKAVTIAKQFGPDVINSVRCCSRSRSCWRCASSRPPARPAANSACSGTCSQQRPLPRQYRQPHPICQLPVTQLPVRMPGSSPADRRRAERPAGHLPISPIVAAGVLSGTAPFGFLIGKLIAGGLATDVHHQCARTEGHGALARRAESGRAVRRHRELPCRRRISGAGAGHARPGHRSTTSATASASPSRRPC